MDLLDRLDGGNSNSLDGFAHVATAPRAAAASGHIFESEQFSDSDDDDEAPAGQPPPQQPQQPPQQQQQQQQQEVPTCLPGMLGRVLLLPSVSYHLVLICLDNKHSVCLCTQYYQYGQDQQQPYSLKNRLISGNRNMEEEDEAEIAHQVPHVQYM